MLTFYQSDMPNMATHCAQVDCGYSLYRGVLVQWDEDHDERVLGVLDAFPPHVISQLLIVQEHEGMIAFVWRDTVPSGYEEGGPGITVSDGDWWSVGTSSAVAGGLS